MEITLKKELIKLYACNEAIEWVGEKTLKEAWKECEHADWLLWYLTYKINRKRLVKITAMCAETVLHIYETEYPNDASVRDCINACYDYADGKITVEELNKYSAAAVRAARAANAAADAAYAAAYADAADAANAVADAADAADAAYAANAASYAADAVYAAYAAAYATDADVYAAADAKSKQHKLMCNIIRKEIKLEELI